MSERDQLLAAFDALLARARALDPEVVAEMGRRVGAAAGPATSGGDAAGTGDATLGLIGTCEPMVALRQRLVRFAIADVPVLITGESGTGKERVARALHAVSRRSAGPFVAENCAAIPETLMESVLFGHRRGAFTGAVRDHPGHFVAANRGTLFLDEIGELRPPLQAKLLRVLQESEVRAVGAARVQKIDVRVLAATNADLEAAVAAGRFREDLYFRLNVLRLELPPLRERGRDILLLARHFLDEAAARAGRTLRLSDAAAARLLGARWPGNVRQLQNEMQRATALCNGDVVDADDLSPELS